MEKMSDDERGMWEHKILTQSRDYESVSCKINFVVIVTVNYAFSDMRKFETFHRNVSWEFKFFLN